MRARWSAQPPATRLRADPNPVNEKDAHQWRVHLVRILSVNGMGLTPSELRKDSPKSAKLLLEHRARYARMLADKFLRGTAQFLLKSQSLEQRESCFGRLEQQLDLALQQSAKLWTHRSFMRCLDLGEIKRLRWDTMKVAPGAMQTHQSQKLEQPAQYNDQPIIMVVQPAIVACGTEEGQNYGAISRVWLRARVWVGGDGPDVKEQELEAARRYPSSLGGWLGG